MTKVFVLKIRNSGEEDNVFVFNQYSSACAKVFEYFDIAINKDATKEISRLELYLYYNDIGYFSIFPTRIQ